MFIIEYSTYIIRKKKRNENINVSVDMTCIVLLCLFQIC